MAKKVLVVGSNGLLGQKAVGIFSEKYEVITAGIEDRPFTNSGFPYLNLDITRMDQVEQAVNQSQPDLIFNAAAYTQVDKAEIEKELCYAVNVTGPEILARVAAKENIVLIHISTDYVFDGTKGDYKETDPANPLGYYGHSKYLGEQAVQAAGGDHIIARTAVLYGAGVNIQSNFVMWALNSLKATKTIRVVDDQIGNPTIAEDLARMCLALVEMRSFGLYHAAGSEPVSRYHLTRAIAEEFGLDGDLITRIQSKDFPQQAPRPMDASLNVDKIQSLGITPLDVKAGLRLLKESLS